MSDLKDILLNRNVVVPKDYETFKNIFRHIKGAAVGNIKGDGGPLMNRPDEFYLKPSTEGGLLQGDILENIPATWIQLDDEGTMKAFASTPGFAMVVSNECDCEKREGGSQQAYVRLCSVLFQSDLLDGIPPAKKNDAKGKLERNYYTEYFWMPDPFGRKKPFVADLSHFFSVSLDDLYSKIEDGTVKKTVSLSQEGYFVFLTKMAWFMLRPAAPDTARKELMPWRAK